MTTLINTLATISFGLVVIAASALPATGLFVIIHGVATFFRRRTEV